MALQLVDQASTTGRLASGGSQPSGRVPRLLLRSRAHPGEDGDRRPGRGGNLGAASGPATKPTNDIESPTVTLPTACRCGRCNVPRFTPGGASDGPMIIDGFVHQIPDTDPTETEEWLQSLDAVVDAHGKTRARFLVRQAAGAARELQVAPRHRVHALRQHHPARGGAVVPRRRAPRAPHPGVHPLERGGDGHQGQQARRRDRRPPVHLRLLRRLYDVGFNHFFQGKDGRPRRRPRLHPGPRRPASTPGPSSRAGSPRTPPRPVPPGGRRRGSPATPTPGSCRTSGSTPRCRWAWGRSTRSTTPASCATSTTGASTTPAESGCGASSATARSTSPRPSGRSRWPPGSSSTT